MQVLAEQDYLAIGGYHRRARRVLVRNSAVLVGWVAAQCKVSDSFATARLAFTNPYADVSFDDRLGKVQGPKDECVIRTI